MADASLLHQSFVAVRKVLPLLLGNGEWESLTASITYCEVHNKLSMKCQIIVCIWIPSVEFWFNIEQKHYRSKGGPILHFWLLDVFNWKSANSCSSLWNNFCLRTFFALFSVKIPFHLKILLFVCVIIIVVFWNVVILIKFWPCVLLSILLLCCKPFKGFIKASSLTDLSLSQKMGLNDVRTSSSNFTELSFITSKW